IGRRAWAVLPQSRFRALALQDARRDEEEQLLRRGLPPRALEQVADDRDAAEQRHLGDVGGVVGDHHPADHHRAPVVDQDLGGGGLRGQRRDAVDAGNTGVDGGVLNHDVEEDRAVGGDLRLDLQAEHHVDELGGDGVVHHRLHRDAGALLDLRLDVVLRNQPRLGEHLGDVAGLGRAQDDVQGHVRPGVAEEQGGGGGPREVREQRLRPGAAAGDQRGRNEARAEGARVRQPAADHAAAVAGAGRESQVGAQLARESAAGADHAGFDLHLQRLAVELLDQVVDPRDHRGDVADDQGVGAVIPDDLAPGREEALEGGLEVVRLGVAQLHGVHHRLGGFLAGAGGGEVAVLFLLGLQAVAGGDAEHVAFQGAAQAVVAQDDVQGLVPGNVNQHQGDRAADVRVHHDVQAADLVDQAEEVLQVNVLQVHRNGFARVLGAGLTGGRLPRGRRYRRGGRRHGGGRLGQQDGLGRRRGTAGGGDHRSQRGGGGTAPPTHTPPPP